MIYSYLQSKDDKDLLILVQFHLNPKLKPLPIPCCPGNVTKLTICHAFYIKPSTMGTSGITAK